jgi:carbonic anhydrase/acetyltransferase-like protein (isoleucine patch superfamily)
VSDQIYALGDKTPVISKDAFIAPNAVIIGDAHIAAHANIWFNCVLRADTNRIVIGERSNIQDGVIIHVNEGDDMACLIGADCSVGHGAIIHAARLEDRAFVGMGAIVLDRAVIESGGMLAAGAVLSPGKILKTGELWAGTPAKFLRLLTDAERVFFAKTAPGYVRNGQIFAAGLQRPGRHA